MKNKELSFGEQLVGLTFNPSGDAKVTKIKKTYAELADIINDTEFNDNNYKNKLIKDKAIMDILSACMSTVKLLTIQY